MRVQAPDHLRRLGEETRPQNPGTTKRSGQHSREAPMSMAKRHASCLRGALSLEHTHGTELSTAHHARHPRRRRVPEPMLPPHIRRTRCGATTQGAEQNCSTCTASSHRILLRVHLQRSASREKVPASCIRDAELLENVSGKQNDRRATMASADAYCLLRLSTSEHVTHGCRGMEPSFQSGRA